MRVVGTAGHVDHGKSTLVRALTGIDPDRLQEEKLRGMTIDLGFAWMDLPLETGHVEAIGIVDVPGHIDFIKNMLAGVGGIDAAILVIAADEGVMPQTREHLAILDLLAIPAAVVALTKCDVVDDPEWLDLVELDVDELLTDTQFAGAPIIRVSALRGFGLDDLRRAVADALRQLPQRRNRARPRLPIDRIFTLSGFGTVVTGTLSDGVFREGDVVEVLPGGLPGRIRGMQTHRTAVKVAEPGSRVALNLAGVATEQLHRGNVVALPGTLAPTRLVDVAFRLLADAPKPMLHNVAVDLFSGAAEMRARVRLIGAERLAPDDEGWLQLRLEQPAVLAAGDRFILRQASPSLTLGGGVVLDPHPRRRWRRFDPAVAARFGTLARGAPDEILLATAERRPFSTEADLRGDSGLDMVVAQQALDGLRGQKMLVAIAVGDEARWVTAGQWGQVVSRLLKVLEDFHGENPLRRGLARGELRNRLQRDYPSLALTVRLFNAIVEAARTENQIGADDGGVWRSGFEVRLSPEQEETVERTLGALAAHGYSPPAEHAVVADLGQDQALLDLLLEDGRLVRVAPGIVYRREEYIAIEAAIRDYIQAHQSITLAEARDLLDTSRKYAQAVLENMDARRITRREGDARVLRVAQG